VINDVPSSIVVLEFQADFGDWRLVQLRDGYR
jgi:hypothetical protein